MAKLVQIDILAHADFSGRHRKTKRSPGYAAFASLVENIRAENPNGTAFLDAGDEFCVNHWGGLPVVGAMSLLKTDAMTLGNHEFDRGREFLTTCIAHADFPILCANVVEKQNGAFVAGTTPWAILEKAGVKIGILGLTTEYTPYMVTASAFEPFEVRSAIDACRTFIPQMKAAGAQITVVLSHFPFYIEDDDTISGELYDVMRESPPVDVFIGGHIPGDYAAVVGGTAVLKGGFSGKSLPHARLWFDPEKAEVVKKECLLHLTDPDAPVKEAYRAYEQKITAPFEAFFSEPLAIAEERWALRLSAESKLGNFLADCMREGAGTEIAYMNATSAGGTIEPGVVTAEDVMAVMGYNDPIYTTSLTGEQLYRLFELVYEPERFGNNAGLLYSGLIVHADHTKPGGQKILNITLRDGTPLLRENTYTVATSEYMASGGNDTSDVAKEATWKKTNLLIYDAIFNYLRKYKEMRVSPEQRMHEIGRPENDNAPF